MLFCTLLCGSLPLDNENIAILYKEIKVFGLIFLPGHVLYASYVFLWFLTCLILIPMHMMVRFT